MKKLVSILMVIIMILGVASVVNATSSSELADKLYEIGKPYGFSSANKVRVERYLADNKVTDEEADKVVEKAKEVAKVFEDAGAKKYSDLSDSQKEKVKSLANETAGIIGLTLKFKAKSLANETAGIIGLTLKFKAKEVEIYKNGKLIETARYDGSKLVYTGNNVNAVLVVSSVVVIALVAGFALRKKFANA